MHHFDRRKMSALQSPPIDEHIEVVKECARSCRPGTTPAAVSDGSDARSGARKTSLLLILVSLSLFGFGGCEMGAGSLDPKKPDIEGRKRDLSQEMKTAGPLNAGSQNAIKNYQIRLGLFPFSVITPVAPLNGNDLQDIKKMQAELDKQIGELIALKGELGKFWFLEAQSTLAGLEDESIKCERLITDLTAQLEAYHLE
jgi:hypothetical protein